MVFYALLSNTLLLTVLVAILGNTFATINADAAAEVSVWKIQHSFRSYHAIIVSQCLERLFLLLKV